ncbi:DEAD/DEAH box helicase [Acidiferrimicrobium sp. IK]|uniref:DEAD/DEAH box helicase n=1 Tax=Acidiferrimicrobium sp. IK TaxID=2871700 RepID=UPI0021CB06AC|nr:DEAD/DEAH box helicase [Acidiferrimicrobium sp. IK]MCU4186022.1 DEAD/DEAH box helicase [Acidiferrimicrobium sp. IK]
MTRQIRLRPWQKAALERFRSSGRPDFLAVATPGAGKTTFALTAALGEMATPGGPRRLIVVAPTAHLKVQWARAAASFGIHLEPTWAAADGALPADMHGIVTTYQQVATSARVLAGLATDAMVIFDEIHHAGDDRAWGDAIRTAFGPSRRRLSLSGTPFRSDTLAIPFITYALEEARPDFEYGYGAALADGRVVRPVYFPRTGGQMEWSAPDGAVVSATFDDALDQVRANQRLRTALSLEGDWLPTVLRSAHDRLTDIRRTHPDAGGLVIATDQDHAKGIADALAWRHSVRPVIATSDDPSASARIARFAASDEPWLVAVRMVSEGVDIPRLRVGVYATTTTTELFFRQAVGRFVRWTRGVPAQRSYLYIPDDARLRARAFQIAEVRRHSLRPPSEKEETPIDPAALDELPATNREAGDDQLSLFAVISAVATDTDTHGHDEMHGESGSDGALDGADDGPTDVEEDDPSLLVALPALATLHATSPGAGGDLVGPDGTVMTRREHKAKLREANAELARALVHRTGWPHAKVNAELNRLAGVRRITEATAEQLQRRLTHAERWYARV